MFTRDLIVITEEVFNSKEDIISYFAHLKNPSVNDALAYQKDLLKREETISTFIGFDTAIPHAKSEAVNEPFAIYVRFQKPVIWDEEPVKQIFMLGVPADKNGNSKGSNLHLKILSELSKRLMREGFRNQMNEAKNEDEVFSILENIEKEIVLWK